MTLVGLFLIKRNIRGIIIHFITDIQGTEPDILTPVKQKPLLIIDLDSNIIERMPAPDEGWTHEKLEEQAAKLNDVTSVVQRHTLAVNGLAEQRSRILF